MHEWLTVIVVLLIVGILLDGWRRMRNARRDNIRMPRKPHRAEKGTGAGVADTGYTSELPNGGARVIPKSGNQASAPDKKSAGQPASRIPQQVTLNLDESVPMLMESVEEQERTEPVIDPLVNDQQPDPLDPDRQEPGFSALDEDEGDFDTPATEQQNDAETLPAQPDEVIIINVMAPAGDYFAGSELLDALLQNGMRFGDMSIFHRHHEASGNGPVIFSLANMVKPGTFDLDAMEDFHTPGVSLFMTLPLKVDSLRAFDTMRDIAQDLCDTLGGELKDENRSVMTRQTMEHCRQRIADYERRRLSRAGA